MHFEYKLNKNETESKMENPTHQRDEPCASAHIRITNKKLNCEELELAKRTKKEAIFWTVYFVRRKIF